MFWQSSEFNSVHLELEWYQKESELCLLLQFRTKSVLNEKKAKITIFSNSFMHLRQTFALLPKGLTNPVLIEFFLNHTDGTSENIYLQVTGFLSQLLELRKQYKLTIIVLGPVVKGSAKISYEHYLKDKPCGYQNSGLFRNEVLDSSHVNGRTNH